MTLPEIISQLSSIQLENAPKCKGIVHRLVDSVFPIAWLHYPLKVGTIITRCRKNAPNLEKESFSCKQPETITDFQRASIPYESVFYGAVGDGSVEYGDFIAMLETSTLHRKRLNLGQEKIDVSRWRVTNKIDMVLICHPKVFVDTNNGAVNTMQRNYCRLLPEYPAEPDFIPLFDKLVEFIAGQFAKRVPEGDNSQYMISAYFAHNTLETESGIIFPSVQVDGNLGINVALKRDVVENNLEFIGAEKHILYKADNYLQVPANTYSDEQIARYLDIANLNNLPIIN